MGFFEDERRVLLEDAPSLEEQHVRKEAQLRKDLPLLQDQLTKRGCDPKFAQKLLAMWAKSYRDYTMTTCMEYWEDWMECRMYELDYRLSEGPPLPRAIRACHRAEHAWLQICVREIYKLPED